MKSSVAIVMGLVRSGKTAVCGETMKNQYIIDGIKPFFNKVIVSDFYGWKRRPWVIAQFILALITHRKAVLILSTSAQNIYPLIKVLYYVPHKLRVVHWVIGGSFHKKVMNGTYKARYFDKLLVNFVESTQMVESLKKCGVSNAVYVPNFKSIPNIPCHKTASGTIRFIFLSRIIPQKGVDYILEAAKQLNTHGLSRKFTIDFFGEIEKSYEQDFKQKISGAKNIAYKGLLKLREPGGYEKLTEYDMMLFPSYWKGEGFAGVFIDAFIAGLPVLASDWNFNPEIIEHGKTGLVIPVHSVSALHDAMLEVIEDKIDLRKMSENCRAQAAALDVSRVITQELFTNVHIL